jgi:hypothetical protein
MLILIKFLLTRKAQTNPKGSYFLHQFIVSKKNLGEFSGFRSPTNKFEDKKRELRQRQIPNLLQIIAASFSIAFFLRKY